MLNLIIITFLALVLYLSWGYFSKHAITATREPRTRKVPTVSPRTTFSPKPLNISKKARVFMTNKGYPKVMTI